MTKTEQLYREIEALSEEAQDFFLDFVAFLKQHYSQDISPIYLEKSSSISEKKDSLIGLFNGFPNLSTDAEDILQANIQRESRWT